MSDENITQIAMSQEALDRILEGIGVNIGVKSDIAKEQHELLILIYEELEAYGKVTPETYSAIVKQINRGNDG